MNIAIIMTVVLCIIVLQNEVNNEKILLCLTITLLMLNCGCGCHSIQGTDASNNQFCDEQFFDAEMANKPTTAEIERITQGMAFYDVVKIIGNEKVKKVVDEFRGLNENICIKYIANHRNLGSAKTRNIGIDMAAGEYVCFLDDDDIYLPERIANQLEPMMEVDADYSITDLALYNEKDKLVEVRKRDYIEETTSEKLFQYHLMYHMTGTDTLMFKKEYLNKIDKFDPIDVGDEFYLMSKAILEGGRFLYAPVCDMKAYIHSAGGGLSSGDAKIDGENQLYEYKKKYFAKLPKSVKKYITVRHYIVLAYANLKSKQYLKCLKNLIIAFLNSAKISFELYRTHRSK